jgi:cytochrome P450
VIHYVYLSCPNFLQVSSAGAETTTGAIMTFILAMLKNPDVQRQAQSEIDSVLGPQRLPTFSDLNELPYFSAIIKEVLRFVLFEFYHGL